MLAPRKFISRIHMGRSRDRKDEALTIVGGRPNESNSPSFSAGMEGLLVRAARDKKFLSQLFEDRERALDGYGGGLSASEKSVLQAIGNEELLSIINHLVVPKIQRRSFIHYLVTSVAAILAFFLGGNGSKALEIGPVRHPQPIAPEPIPVGIRPGGEGGSGRGNEPPRRSEPRRPVAPAGIRPGGRSPERSGRTIGDVHERERRYIDEGGHTFGLRSDKPPKKDAKR